MDTILQVHQVKRSFAKKIAIDKVDLYIKAGEAYGLLGPNGAGKSTLINIIAGILEPEEGDISIGGFSIKKQRKLAQQLIGLVPQEIALYPSMTAEENLRFFGKLYGLRKRELDEAVDTNLQLVGLYERRKEKVQTYSGGMKRRINIAAALLHEPKLIIMDEPTVGIDPQSRSHILETVKKLQQKKGMSILYTSHYMEEIEVLCDRIGIIDNGRIVSEGTIRELKQQFNVQTGDLQSNDTVEPNLESIFLALTGKSLRDE